MPAVRLGRPRLGRLHRLCGRWPGQHAHRLFPGVAQLFRHGVRRSGRNERRPRRQLDHSTVPDYRLRPPKGLKTQEIRSNAGASRRTLGIATLAGDDEPIQSSITESELSESIEPLEVPAPPAVDEPAPMEELPVLTVRDTVIFPGALLPITVGRPSSIALVQSLGENRALAVVSQLDPRVDTPRPED